MYDVNQRKTFEQLDDWIKEAQKYGATFPVVLVLGNKIDQKRKSVTDKEGRDWAQANNYLYVTISNNHNLHI